jgi:tetratricopeptide (TPR) repeat protein
LSQLSAAFLSAKSALHLQFAYYESALAVAFLVERTGLATLKEILDDLGAGVPMNEALPRRTKMSLKELDDQFARFARERANRVAAGATWDEPELPGDADSAALGAWVETHPKSFHGWRRFAARLVAEGKLGRAKGAVETLRTMYPEYVGPENAYMLLAALSRKQSDPAAERKALEELVARDGSASPAFLRLLELEEAASDWQAVNRDARRLLAVNPLIPAPYRRLARASEQLGDVDQALAAYQAVALLDDSDPADVHYRLARILQKQGKRDEARREVLKSLEEAPRFLDAHRLLLEMVESHGVHPDPSSPPRR